MAPAGTHGPSTMACQTSKATAVASAPRMPTASRCRRGLSTRTIEEFGRPGHHGTERAERRDPGRQLVAEAQGVVEEVRFAGRRGRARRRTRRARHGPRSAVATTTAIADREPQPCHEPRQRHAGVGGRRQVRERVRGQGHAHDRERDPDTEPDPPGDGRVEDGLAVSKAAEPRRAGDQGDRHDRVADHGVVRVQRERQRLAQVADLGRQEAEEPEEHHRDGRSRSRPAGSSGSRPDRSSPNDRPRDVEAPRRDRRGASTCSTPLGETASAQGDDVVGARAPAGGHRGSRERATARRAATTDGRGGRRVSGGGPAGWVGVRAFRSRRASRPSPRSGRWCAGSGSRWASMRPLMDGPSRRKRIPTRRTASMAIRYYAV